MRLEFKRNFIFTFFYFRESNKPIPHTCRGFFLDYRHLEKHFMDLSGTSGLTAVVEQNLKKQMGKKEGKV